MSRLSDLLLKDDRSQGEREELRSLLDRIGGGSDTLDQIFGPTGEIARIRAGHVIITKAFRPPVMTTAQRDAIASPENGMLIWNSTTGQLEDYNGGWAAV